MKYIHPGYRCVHCDKLLFKGLLLSGNLEIKCSRCKAENLVSGLSVSVDDRDQYILLFDYKGRVLDASIAASHFLGYAREELLHMNREDFNPHLSAAEYADLCRILGEGLSPIAFDTWHRRKDGESLPVKVRVKVLNTQQTPTALVIVKLLPTPSPEAATSVAPYELEINNAGNLTYVNTALAQRLGYRIFSILGTSIAALCESTKAWLEHFSKLLSTEKSFQIKEVPLRCINGALVTMDLSFHPRVEDDESFIGYSIAGLPVS